MPISPPHICGCPHSPLKASKRWPLHNLPGQIQSATGYKLFLSLILLVCVEKNVVYHFSLSMFSKKGHSEAVNWNGFEIYGTGKKEKGWSFRISASFLSPRFPRKSVVSGWMLIIVWYRESQSSRDPCFQGAHPKVTIRRSHCVNCRIVPVVIVPMSRTNTWYFFCRISVNWSTEVSGKKSMTFLRNMEVDLCGPIEWISWLLFSSTYATERFRLLQ